MTISTQNLDGYNHYRWYTFTSFHCTLSLIQRNAIKIHAKKMKKTTQIYTYIQYIVICHRRYIHHTIEEDDDSYLCYSPTYIQKYTLHTDNIHLYVIVFQYITHIFYEIQVCYTETQW